MKSKNNSFRIAVIFVEPMLYNMDLINEVYSQTPYDYQYIYCERTLTGKDNLVLPKCSVVCGGDRNQKKQKLYSTLKEFKPNFVIINGYVGTVQSAAIRFCKKNHVPYAIESDTPLNVPKNPIKAILKKMYLYSQLHNKYCHGFPGGTLQKENLVYYGISKTNCFIMPMSVSSDRLNEEYNRLPIKENIKKELDIKEKKIILFVGRLEKVKGVSDLIIAFSQLKRMMSDVALVLVGSGNEETILKELVRKENVTSIYFMGYQTFPALIKYYKIADTFVLPSTYEPWGLVVNEAMTLGLPVIVSSVVGCRSDLIKNGKNGFIFECENRTDLCDKMKDVLNVNNTNFGECSKSIIAQWDYSCYYNMFLKAVEEICRP